MGFIMFLVYACHRLNKKYAQEIKAAHRKPTCYHILPTNQDPVPQPRAVTEGANAGEAAALRPNYDTRGSRVSMGGLLYNRRSLVPGYARSVE